MSFLKNLFEFDWDQEKFKAITFDNLLENLKKNYHKFVKLKTETKWKFRIIFQKKLTNFYEFFVIW